MALSQVEALFRLRSDSGIPSISTAYAQVRPHCAQVIHIFVHRQGSKLRAGGRRQRISPPSGTGMPVGLPVSRSLDRLRVLVRLKPPPGVPLVHAACAAPAAS